MVRLKHFIIWGFPIATIILLVIEYGSLFTANTLKNLVIEFGRQNDVVQHGEQSVATIPMVLSLTYWEQFGNALRNLFDLQCWAQSVNITSVVEPFISVNKEEKVFQFRSADSALALGDIINLPHWNKVSSSYNFSVIVSKSDFLKYASKRMLHIQLKFRTGHFQCRSLSAIKHTGWFKYFTKEGFSIETMCVDAKDLSFSNKVLTEQVFGELKGESATIVFDEWRGISNTNERRLRLRGSSCYHCLKRLIMPKLSPVPPAKIEYPSYFATPLAPSDYIVKVINEFKRQHIGQGQVIAVVVRSEKLRNTSWTCGKAILSDTQLARAQIKAHSALLFMDFSRLGSVTFKRSHSEVVRLMTFLEKWIRPVVSTWTVDKILSVLAGTETNVVFGMVVSALVASADCVVLVGGGAFHSNILNMYAHGHRGRECIYYRGGYCQQQYISQFDSL